MKKKPCSNTFVFETAFRCLNTECAKLSALAHLLEYEDIQEGLPLDWRDVRWGIGLLLNQSIDRIRNVAAKLESQSLGKGNKHECG